jgi:hypothetical protein
VFGYHLPSSSTKFRIFPVIELIVGPFEAPGVIIEQRIIIEQKITTAVFITAPLIISIERNYKIIINYLKEKIFFEKIKDKFF